MNSSSLEQSANGLQAKFRKSCNRGNINEMREIIQNMSASEIQNALIHDNHQALFTASIRGYLNILQLLLEHGADVHAITTLGKTPLHEACSKDHIEVMKLLIKGGADVNAQDKYGTSPLSMACDKNNIEMTMLLIEEGADINALDKYGKSVLFRACSKGHAEVMKLLIEGGADINALDKYGASLLSIACAKDHKEVMKILIERGADINALDKYGASLLSTACDKNNIEMAKLLIEGGADINARDKYGKSPLSKACSKGHKEVMKILIERGADINALDKYGASLLSMACSKQQYDVVELLLSQRDKNGYTQCDVELLPRNIRTLLAFFPNDDDKHREMRRLLRAAGCREIMTIESQKNDQEIQKFIGSAQNTHDSFANQAIDETVANMRRIAGYGELTSASPDNVLLISKQQELINQYHKSFLNSIREYYPVLLAARKKDAHDTALKMLPANGVAKDLAAYKDLVKRKEKAVLDLEEGYKRLLVGNQFTRSVNGANNIELYSLIAAVIEDKCHSAEAMQDAYFSVLQEASEKHRVCAHGFFNGISQALSIIPDIVISAETLIAPNLKQSNQLLELTKGLVNLEQVKEINQEIIENILAESSSARRNDILNLASRIPDKNEAEQLEGKELTQDEYIRYHNICLAERNESAKQLRGLVKARFEKDFVHYQSLYLTAYNAQSSQEELQNAVFVLMDKFIDKSVQLLAQENPYIKAMHYIDNISKSEGISAELQEALDSLSADSLDYYDRVIKNKSAEFNIEAPKNLTNADELAIWNKAKVYAHSIGAIEIEVGAEIFHRNQLQRAKNNLEAKIESSRGIKSGFTPDSVLDPLHIQKEEPVFMTRVERLRANLTPEELERREQKMAEPGFMTRVERTQQRLLAEGQNKIQAGSVELPSQQVTDQKLDEKVGREQQSEVLVKDSLKSPDFRTREIIRGKIVTKLTR